MSKLNNENLSMPKSQQERVIAVCSDGKYRTLDDIQREIKKRFNQFDTTPAISARLRENSKLSKYGYMKDKYHKINEKTKKICYYYTLKRVAQ
ncbi:hypothetical protein [Gilliamella mensalis]|uniref:hypothetical protein n=1 Tax=Gilliamella mensalis TaxID=1908520 RepID=UPI000A1656D0|nr:hypothetical protein [Gilliamella mensalis]